VHLRSQQVVVNLVREGPAQRELAERLGMNRNTVTRYERGMLSIPKYVQLAMQALAAEGIAC
jgi:transcriptional regulator with XRE-family HTH domain